MVLEDFFTQICVGLFEVAKYCVSLNRQSHLFKKSKTWFIKIIWGHKFDHTNPAIFVEITVIWCIAQPKWVNLLEKYDWAEKINKNVFVM